MADEQWPLFAHAIGQTCVENANYLRICLITTNNWTMFDCWPVVGKKVNGSPGVTLIAGSLVFDCERLIERAIVGLLSPFHFLTNNYSPVMLFLCE